MTHSKLTKILFFNIKGIWHHNYLIVVQTANHYLYRDVQQEEGGGGERGGVGGSRGGGRRR
jgi:hypothetical protein